MLLAMLPLPRGSNADALSPRKSSDAKKMPGNLIFKLLQVLDFLGS